MVCLDPSERGEVDAQGVLALVESVLGEIEEFRRQRTAQRVSAVRARLAAVHARKLLDRAHPSEAAKAA